MLAIDLNPVAAIAAALQGVAEKTGEAAVSAVAEVMFGLVADAVQAITTMVVSAMNATTEVDLDGGFFPALTPIRQTVLGMSAALVLALLFLSVLRSMATGEPGAIVRAVLVDVPAAILTTTLSVAVAWVLIRVVDQASLAVAGDVASSMGRLSAAMSTADALGGSGLLGLIFGLLFITGSILVWLQLLVRSALLYILVVLAPLGLATRAHPATRSVARRTIEVGLALIMSKFAIAVAFGVGAAALDSGPTGQGAAGDLGGMTAGVAAVLMAAFMPWAIWKVIPVAEAAATVAGVERAPVRSAMTAVSVGVAASAGASRLAGSGRAGGSVAQDLSTGPKAPQIIGTATALGTRPAAGGGSSGGVPPGAAAGGSTSNAVAQPSGASAPSSAPVARPSTAPGEGAGS